MSLPVDPAALSTQQLEAAIIALAAEAADTRYRLLRLLALYDRRGAWAASGATSCAAWWARVADLELGTAREHLRVARAIEELPPFAAALADRRLSYAKVKVLSRLADAHTVDELIDLGRDCPAARLPVVLAAWTADRLSPQAIADAQHDARSVTYRVEPDGMITTNIRQAPANGAALQATIDRLITQDDTPAGASLAQLRADALARLVAGDVAVSGGAEVVVHVHHRADGAVVATLDDGTPVPEPDLAAVLCDATIRALVHDSAGRPIDASPAAPAPSRRQRRLVQTRDQHCQARGCTARAFLHVHHVIPRASGGPTIIPNLVLLCSFHHRALHRDGVRWRPDWWTEQHERRVRRAMPPAPPPQRPRSLDLSLR